MTRYQPALRPIISTDLVVNSWNVSKGWKKHSVHYKLSKKVQMISKCRFLRAKAKNKLSSLRLSEIGRERFEEDQEIAFPDKVSQGTQTLELELIDDVDLRNSPTSPKDEENDKFIISPSSKLKHFLKQKHQKRQFVLERVERDLEERSLSRNEFTTDPKLVALSPTWRYTDCKIDGWTENISELNEMAPLLSETYREPVGRRRVQQSYHDDLFYQQNELGEISRDYHGDFRTRDISPSHDPIATILPENKRGKLVTFYKNGDPFFRGFTTSVNEKDFRNFETLMQWLTEKVETPYSVRFVFSLHDGREVKSIDEFKQARSYVISGSNKLIISCTYGPKKHRVWSSQPALHEKIRNGDIYLYKGLLPREATSRTSPQSRRPRILTIISNLDRSSREKLILNPQTSLTFDELVSDLTSLIRVPRPPVKALYTERPPHTRIQSYSQLLREYKDHVNFIACGEEGKPTEMTSKRHAPGSNSSTESTSSRPFRKPRKLQKHNYSASDASQSQTDMSIDVSTNHADTPFPKSGNPMATTRRGRLQGRSHVNGPAKHETVRLSIHGRKKEFYPPSIHDSDDDGGKPDKILKLDWVYGYRGKDARFNLFVVPTSGELLYFVGAVAVLYDRKKDTQRHYCGHSEDVISMALHPDKRLVASGQQSGKSSDNASHVRVWDTISLSTYSIIGLGAFQSSVSSVSFSVQSQGDFVLAVDDGEKHTISVWDWQNSTLVAKTTTTTDMVVWARFHNLDDSILVTFGRRHIYFWRLVWTSREEGEGKIVRDKESGIFRDDVRKIVTSLAFSALGDVIVGDSSGNITVWSRDATDAFRVNHACSDNMKGAHKKSVFSLVCLEDGTLLSGGGSEIKSWDSQNYYRLIKERTLPDTAGFIRTLVPSSDENADGLVYIGTTKNHVLEGSLQHKFKFIIQGHSDKLLALAVHPKEPCFFTAGFDLQVCCWSNIAHSVVWRMQLEKPCVSMTIDPTGKMLIIGAQDGKLVVMSAGNGCHISTTHAGLRAINVVKYSPNGLLVAVGFQDGNICLYEMVDDGFYLKKIGSLQGHKTAITHMDWSSDSRFVQSVSADYELYFWGVEDLHHVTAARAMRDVDWSSQSCILSYNIIGPWSNLKPSEDIKCVSRSSFREYLAVGTSGGMVQLYKYPSSVQKAQFYPKKAFSSNVTNLQFAMEDRYLISTGGPEAVLLQWAVRPLLS